MPALALRVQLGGDWANFALTIGKALWGSKWYEVMPGTWHDMPELEKLIASGEVPAAAMTEWGSWSSKLEVVFLVRIPSKTRLHVDRVLPGRDDVYIIPHSECEDGRLLHD